MPPRRFLMNRSTLSQSPPPCHEPCLVKMVDRWSRRLMLRLMRGRYDLLGCGVFVDLFRFIYAHDFISMSHDDGAAAEVPVARYDAQRGGWRQAA